MGGCGVALVVERREGVRGFVCNGIAGKHPRQLYNHAVFIPWLMPQVQEAIGAVVSIWFIISCAAKPPWGAIRRSP